jgi:pyrimidine operon attenuation protein/uracil phosphoribosyltransferase
MHSSPTLLLNREQIQQRIDRLAYQVYEDNYNLDEVFIAGIANSGYTVAERLQVAINRICLIKTHLIRLTVDKDEPTRCTIAPQIPQEQLQNKVVIVVDDVLNSGKTLMYSLRPFLDADMRKIRTVLLVDRDHKRYPVEADFVGITLSTTLQEHVRVELEPGKEAVFLE